MHLIDTTMFFCERGGGVRRYLLAKHRWLAQRHGVRHSLVVPAPQPHAAYVRALRVPALPLAHGYRFPLSISAWQAALERLEPDLIEAGDPYTPGWAARDAARRLNIPVVAFYHSDLPSMLGQRLGSWISPVARQYLRNFYQGVDLVLAPSRVMLERVRDMGIKHSALQPLGVDSQVHSPEKRTSKLRETLNLTPDVRLLIFAGRFAREKNLPVLVEAARRLGPRFHLLLVGAARRERLTANVTTLPFQHRPARVARLLASADAFVHAGDRETFGLVVAEALACGLPVVAVASGAVPELVSGEVGELVPRARPDEFVQAVHALFERDQETLRRAARAKATGHLSWDAAFRVLLGHYARVKRVPMFEPAKPMVAAG
jgi:alpha-1,6-mannosyltransferase